MLYLHWAAPLGGASSPRCWRLSCSPRREKKRRTRRGGSGRLALVVARSDRDVSACGGSPGPLLAPSDQSLGDRRSERARRRSSRHDGSPTAFRGARLRFSFRESQRAVLSKIRASIQSRALVFLASLALGAAIGALASAWARRADFARSARGSMVRRSWLTMVGTILATMTSSRQD